MTQQLDPAVELKVQKGIRQAEDNLVIWIQKALDETDYPSNDRDKLEESQFRNLVRVSDTTESPEVVKNFLRYQVGRDKKWGRGKNSLAERIISDIDGNLKNQAAEISKKINDDLNVNGVEKIKEIKEIHIQLIRLYLGYGARHLKYRNDGRS